MTLRSDDYNHGPSLVGSPGKHTNQCEVVTTPASPSMIPVINGISTSFTDPNMTFTHGSKIQSGGYPGAHTIYGDNNSGFLQEKLYSQGPLYVLAAALLITYVILLRRWILRHWKQIVAYFLSISTMIIVVGVCWYFGLPGYLYEESKAALRQQLIPRIMNFQMIWNLMSLAIIASLSTVVYLSTFKNRQPKNSKNSPLVLVQNVEGETSLRREIEKLRHDMDMILDCSRKPPTVAVAKAKLETPMSRDATPPQDIDDVPQPVADALVHMGDGEQPTEQANQMPVPQPQTPAAPAPPPTDAVPRSDGNQQQKNYPPKTCSVCHRTGNGKHTCWQKTKKYTCWMCRQKSKEVSTSYVNQRGNVVTSTQQTPDEKAVRNTAEKLNKLLERIDRLEKLQNPLRTEEEQTPESAQPISEPDSPMEETATVARNFGQVPPQL